MAIKIASWNIAQAYNDDRGPKIEAGIKKLAADVVILSEAFSVKAGLGKDYENDKLDQLSAMAQRLGYKYFEYSAYKGVNYADYQPVDFDLYLVAMGKIPLNMKIKRLVFRNALFLNLKDKQSGGEVTIVGCHLDDLNEPSRLKMAEALVSHLEDVNPAVIVGDMNSMHRDSWQAGLVNGFLGQFFLKHMSTKQTQSIADRLMKMANGSTQKYFKDHGFEDADISKKSTFIYRGIVFAQLDHILTRHIKATHFKRHKFSGSDHVAVSSTLT